MTEEDVPGLDAATEVLLAIELLIKIVAQGVDAIPRGQFPLAERCFAAIRKTAEEAHHQLAPVLPMAMFGQSLVKVKQGRHTEARAIRDQGLLLINDGCRSVPLSIYHYFMALLLQRQQAYTHALPFWELALQHAREDTSPMLVAEMLREIGEAYCHVGLTDFACIPLRAALKILDKTPEHPWRNATLLTLGNSLRKAVPDEAEQYFREAAESHASRLQLLSAAPAWVNLGILCSEQGRYAESLEFYNKALRVREANPQSDPERIAGLHNNIANCYRRMKSFDEALASVDRAISLYPKNNPRKAYAFSTRAMTLRDAGCDEEAVEWFRKSIAERKLQASPSFEATVDDLQGLIDALKRLGRDEEVPLVEQELEALRREMKSVAAVAQQAGEYSGSAEGVVFVEVPIGTMHANTDTRERIRKVVHELHAKAKSRQVGRLTGHITTPENRTLIFNGHDAEALIQVLEPSLAAEELFQGAKVTIRQDDRRREVMLPQRPSAVN